MVPPFLPFPHMPFLALLGSICLLSVLIMMVAFFQTPMIFSPIILMPQVLRFVKTHCFARTIVIPDVRPRVFVFPVGPPGFSGHSSPPLTTGLFFLLASPLGFVALPHRSRFGFISIDLFRSVSICCHAFTP